MNLTILSNDSEPFEDRNDAGRQLGHALSKKIAEKPLILGIPRGGLVTARAISSVLDCDIDIMLTHKIRAPYNPELAIGAISEEGKVYLNDHVVRSTGATDSYIESEKDEQLSELNRRKTLFRSIYPKIPLKNRTVIITDDGVATGATIHVALWAARQERPKKLIGAFPVAPVESLRRLSKDADEIICLKAPDSFQAIGQFYSLFDQVSDEEVVDILKQEYEQKKARNKKCAHH